MTTVKKTAVLVQAHKESEYLKQLASLNPDVNFYLHFDIKSQIDLAGYKEIQNITVLENRVNVKWGGFSQVEATLLLLKESLKNSENFFFHLISGEDCILLPFDIISNQMNLQQPEIYVDFRYSLKHRHRSRFFAIHANTYWQRSLVGKVLTKLNVFLDKLLPISIEKDRLYSVYGSSWFSINRIALELLLDKLNQNDCQFFAKKLCPDEHIFQFLLEKNMLKKYNQSTNKRFIDLPDDKNHPRYIELEELCTLASQNYWMARKVTEDVQMAFLRGNE